MAKTPDPSLPTVRRPADGAAPATRRPFYHRVGRTGRHRGPGPGTVPTPPETARNRNRRLAHEPDAVDGAVGVLRAVASRSAVAALLALGGRPGRADDHPPRTLARLAVAGLVVVTAEGTVCLTPTGRRAWAAVRALVV